MIPYGKHDIDDSDIEAVVDVLRHQFLTQGQQVPAFEKALCDYTEARHAVAVNSGTSGLHVACLAAGLTKGDLGWTVPVSFAASANCILYCGADVDFVDIDPATRNICTQALRKKLNTAAQQNRLPRVLVVVHFTGASCDMKAIRALTEPYGIIVIEDAAHALGGRHDGDKIGRCRYSDMAVMSFHPVKSITTAEGGAVLTNDDNLAYRCNLFAKHGITRDPSLMQGESHGPWYYQQLELGYNYRLSDLHAALGLSQLAKLDNFVAKRRELAAKYLSELTELPLALPQISSLHESAWHLFMIEVTRHDRGQVFERLQQRGIGGNVHYIPIHLHPYYRNLGFTEGDFPAAEQFYRRAITIPLFSSLTADEQTRVVKVLTEVLA
ncbi:UDP-4-amino-4,6-dideoxy-N-acetyl-beta-L-altrosamine transaminase [Aestuariibacter salexigens]|uniref:UDP-4-amino-4, 6-dideoxy-N-acetyl-beta-L-altrosamine transaminase n=1 Tax=Aestuariibacter salexigens TaxID=226010 RepID=UPI00040FC22C|nr:UDP-4-amino-4,6-dideoxy-N-acetyl-beta-L-altrosamine transaminase [Aestuariibacter salexigens]